MTEAELIDHARTHLRMILDDYPNLVIAQNRWAFEVVDGATRYPMTEQLMAVDRAKVQARVIAEKLARQTRDGGCCGLSHGNARVRRRLS